MIIDEQFKTLIPPLTDDEFSRLEESILKEGIRDKLVVWGETLIDGHNRFRIATENDLPYETVEMPFESREHALNWIISNQLGRRNLNPNQIAYLRGKRYETEKKIWGGDRGNQYTKEASSQLGNLAKRPKTVVSLAEEYGVGKSTISRNSIYARAVDTLPDEVKQSVLSGSDTVSHESANTILKFDKSTQKKFLKEVESGTPIKEAVKKVDPEQKRKEREEKVRAEMERDRVFRERAKFSPNMRRHDDIITATKEQFLENLELIPSDVEIWVIYKKEVAEEARLTINTHTNLKTN